MGFRYRGSIRLVRGMRIDLQVRRQPFGRSAGSHRELEQARRPAQRSAWPQRTLLQREPVRRGAPIIGWLFLIIAVVAIVVALGR
jgi:hypothetical protein